MNISPTEVASTYHGFREGRDREVSIVTGWVAAVVRGGRWGFSDPDGMIQEILMTLVTLVRRDKVQDPSAFMKFASTVAKRACVDAYYRQRRRDKHETTPDEGFDAPAPPGLDHPAAALDASARIRALCHLAQRMSDDCRRLWTLIYVEKLPSDTVAERLGLSAVNIRVRAHRCLEKAREIVKQFEQNSPDTVRA